MSYADFLHHYGLTGREFGDGYAPRWFDDMSGDERARARAMLLQRGLAGGRVDVTALAYVGDASTVAALDAAEPRAGDPTWDVHRLETLFRLTGERRHLDAMLAWLDDPDAKTRGFAANLLSRQAVPRQMTPDILARIEDGRHEALLLPLVNAWLAAHGVPAGADMKVFERHLPLLRAVRTARPTGGRTPFLRTLGLTRAPTRGELLDAAVRP